ncbi:O-methyltransferase [soil metagenome]
MEPVTADLLERINRYIEERFAALDPLLERNLEAADAAGLPTINVSAAQGKLPYLPTKIAGARRVLEVGTLGGFSTTWLARALPPGGTVVTLEFNPAHADVARRNLEGVAPGVTIDVRVGEAAQSLTEMIAQREPAFDLVFIDADKPGYVVYLDLVLQLSRPGTVILADNVIRHGQVIDETSTDPSATGARNYNNAVASHPRLETVLLPLLRDTIDGVAISIVR